MNILFDLDIFGVFYCWFKEVRLGLDYRVFYVEIV